MAIHKLYATDGANSERSEQNEDTSSLRSSFCEYDADSQSRHSVASLSENEEDEEGVNIDSKIDHSEESERHPLEKKVPGNLFPSPTASHCLNKPVRKGLALPSSLVLAGDAILQILYDSFSHESKIEKSETEVDVISRISMENGEKLTIEKNLAEIEKTGTTNKRDEGKDVIPSNDPCYWTGELNRLESLVAILMEENEELASDVNALSGEKNSLAEENQKLRAKLKLKEEEDQALKDENERLLAQVQEAKENAPTLADKELLALQSDFSSGLTNTSAKVTSPTSVAKLAESNVLSSSHGRSQSECWTTPPKKTVSKHMPCFNRNCQREQEALQAQLMSYMEEIRVLTDVSHTAKLFRAELTKKAKAVEQAWTSPDEEIPESLEQSLTRPLNQLLKHCRAGCTAGQNVLSSSLRSSAVTSRRRSLEGYPTENKGGLHHMSISDRMSRAQSSDNNVEELAAALMATENNLTAEEADRLPFSSRGLRVGSLLGARQGGLLFPPGSDFAGDQSNLGASQVSCDLDDDDLSITSAQSAAVVRPSGMLFGRMFRGRRGSVGRAPSSSQSVC